MTSPQVDPVLVTIAQAARMLALGKTKTYELVASGRIKSVGERRMKRVPVAEIHRWVQENMAQ